MATFELDVFPQMAADEIKNHDHDKISITLGRNFSFFRAPLHGKRDMGPGQKLRGHKDLISMIAANLK